MAQQLVSKSSGVSTKEGEVALAAERLKIATILCPVDFSEFSQGAFQFAIALARHFGSRLLVQHTVQPPMHLFLEERAVNMSAVEQYFQDQLEGSREEIRRMLISNRVGFQEATILLNQGEVCERILETIAKEQVDLLVMGTHGRKGFNRLTLGSVSDGMTHQTACPTLVIGQPRAGFAAPGEQVTVRLRTILLATDFSAHSDRALTYALQWGREWNAKVIVLHAVPEIPPAMKGIVDLLPEYSSHFERQVTDTWVHIHRLIPDAAQHRCEVAYEVRHGNPKEEILRVAEEKGADLIVMGTRGGGSAVPWGSVSSAVVPNGRFPVLVVPVPPVRDLSA
jgi:nucleotide-binding universal stress UspA family protein